MKLRIILSLILALVVMFYSHQLSLRRSSLLVIQSGDVRIEHLTVVNKIGPGDVKIEAKITTPQPYEDYAIKLFYKIDDGVYKSVDFVPLEGDSTSKFIVHISEKGELTSGQLVQKTESTLRFVANIPTQEKGKRAYYYIMVEDEQGNKVTLPDKIETIDPPFMLKFKGEVPLVVIIAHVFGMTAGLFFTFLAFFFAIDTLLGKDVLKRLGFSIFFSAISVFVGGMLVGGMVTHYTFGGYWEGVPIGWDITDNKTLIIFLYWLIMLFLMKGTIFKKDEKLNLLKPKSLATFTLIGVILTILLYLVPHSIRL
ncbi:MAG: hypothetical protein MUO85_06775 [candidate division Zixibacteria bacterium]|nr:hypothetical protein [candidate division Zixibacteria bacterium]